MYRFDTPHTPGQPEHLSQHTLADATGLNAFNLEYLGNTYMHVHSQPVVVGTTPDGFMVEWTVREGHISGPRLNAKLSHFAGDWMLIREDGVGVMDVRAILECADGAVIVTTYSGVCEFGEQGYTNLLKGIWPSHATARCAPRYVTTHPNYTWLNGFQCVGIGMVDMAQKLYTYDVYMVR